MAQLKQTCTVTNGSQTVTMPGVNVATRIKANHIFMVDPDLVPYWVAADSVFGGVDTTFTLTGSYLGATSATANGVVVSDATFPDLIPTLSARDVGTAAVFTAAMYKIQSLLGTGGGGGGATNTDGLPEGAANLYFTSARVLQTQLVGLVAGIASQVVAGDTIIGALQKLQAQVNGSNGGVVLSDTAPLNPYSGMQWIDTVHIIRYTWIIGSGGVGQWVNV